MKYYQLTKVEEQLLKDFESNKLTAVKDADKLKSQFKTYAAETFNKTKNINLRLSQRDLQKLKVKAASHGIPYQTLASSAIHRYITA